MLNNFEMRIFRRDVRHIDIYIYIEKISIEHTSVGLASARPKYILDYSCTDRHDNNQVSNPLRTPTT